MDDLLLSDYTLFLIKNNTDTLQTLIENLHNQNINITTVNLNSYEALSIKKDTSFKTFGDICISFEQCKVLLKDKEVKLSYKEFRLLEALTNQPYKVWTRNELLDKVWSIDFYGDVKTVDVHISWLRRKLNLKSTNSKYLITVRGIGYRFI